MLVNDPPPSTRVRLLHGFPPHCQVGDFGSLKRRGGHEPDDDDDDLFSVQLTTTTVFEVQRRYLEYAGEPPTLGLNGPVSMIDIVEAPLFRTALFALAAPAAVGLLSFLLEGTLLPWSLVTVAVGVVFPVAGTALRVHLRNHGSLSGAVTREEKNLATSAEYRRRVQLQPTMEAR